MRTTPLVRFSIVDLPQRASLSMKVLTVLDVVDLGNELFLYRFAGVKAVEGLANHELKIVIGFFYLTDVDALKIYHLCEPVVHNFGLIGSQTSQVVKKGLLPEDLWVLKHLVNQVHATGC